MYELRHHSTHELILVGYSKNVAYRMTSLLPEPLGRGNRNNVAKRDYVLRHIDDIEYRTLACASASEAKSIEKLLLQTYKYQFPI